MKGVQIIILPIIILLYSCINSKYFESDMDDDVGYVEPKENFHNAIYDNHKIQYINRFQEKTSETQSPIDSFTLTLKIEEIDMNGNKFKLKFKHSEKFKNESSFIIINDSIGFHVAVTQAKYLGEYRNLEKSDFFVKDKGIWKRLGSSGGWAEFELGRTFNGGYVGYNLEGDYSNDKKKYFNYDGLFQIK